MKSSEQRDRRAPAWLKGLSFTPSTLVMNVIATASPFLLVRQGVPVAQIAAIGSVLTSPLVFSFLLKPFLDAGLSRRSYSWICSGIAAVSCGLGVVLLGPRSLHTATVLLFCSAIFAVLYTGAVGGWIVQDLRSDDCGSVSAWQGIALGSVGTLAISGLMWLINHTQWPAAIFGGIVTCLILGSTVPLLFLPKARPSKYRFSEVFTSTLRDIGRAIRDRRNFVGLTLLLSPVGAAAASNLETGFGRDFHASDSTVIGVTVATTIITPFASLFGGWLADRYYHTWLYLSLGALTGFLCLLIAVTPHTANTYVVSILAYDTISGLTYTAYGALALDLSAGSPVASTQLGIFGAAMNAGVVYMTAVDGWGYKHGGIAGLYRVEGVASLASAVVWLVILGKLRGLPTRTVL